MKQILIVEDDSFLNKMLAYNLTADGYGVTSTLNARTAADAIRQREFDLVLLDINLPDGNGFELCKLIKPQHPDTIVIFLTANDQESDQIRGYEAGAVDYITKPFVIGALQRKIKAMFAMLEHHKPAKDIYNDGRLFLDFSEQTASLNGKPLTLSPMEYKMLNLFRKNPRQVPEFFAQPEKQLTPDECMTDEQIQTPRGRFYLTDRSREQMEAAGYGFHHQSEDGKYLIMANGTRAFAIPAQQESHIKTAEMSTEQNYNMIDGMMNNAPSMEELEARAKAGEQISLLDVAEAAKAEAKKPKQTRKTTQKQKKPSIRAQLAAAKEEQKKKPPAREKSKEMEV